MKRMKIRYCAALLAAVMLLSGCGIVYDPDATPPYRPPQNITEPTSTTVPDGWSPAPSPYGAEDFTFENGYLQCRNGGAVMGIDVSDHQGKINWELVKNSEARFAFIRIGSRGWGKNGTLMIDDRVQENLQGAKAAGIPIGCYFFSQALNAQEAREEAELVLSVLNGLELELPVVYDWEYVSSEARTAKCTARQVTDCTLEFCRIIEKAGYQSMIYFNADHARDRLYLEELQQYAWWFARYAPEEGPMCQVDMWQYTDSGTVAGIKVAVDINLMFTEWGVGKQLFGSK